MDTSLPPRSAVPQVQAKGAPAALGVRPGTPLCRARLHDQGASLCGGFWLDLLDVEVAPCTHVCT